MKYNHLMMGASLVLLVLGLSFLGNARWIFSFYGIDISAPSEPRLVIRHDPDPLMVGIAFMRVLGALLVGLGVLAWQVRRVAEVHLQADLSMGFFVLNALAFLIVFLQHAQLSRIVPQLRGTSARILAVVFMLLTAGFGYLRFVKLSGR
jgi:hypothetical protein